MMTRRTGLLFLATVLVTQTGANECTGDVLHDPGFDIWCGDDLCSWDVEKGSIRKASTWHDADLGVELTGDDVVLSQLATETWIECLRFQLVADVAEEAVVTLEMDLDDDGTVEFERQIPSSRWAELVYRVELSGQEVIRFRLRKTGSGRAVLAQIRAVEGSPECGGEVIETSRPLGTGCLGFLGGNSAVCESGVCGFAGNHVCSECDDDADCDGGVCGLLSAVAPDIHPYRSCVAEAGGVLGELCSVDGECASGECCDGVCSQCCEFGAACAEGQSCTRAEDPPGESWCSPGAGAAGDPCRRDEQCASGTCAGEPMMVCASDGRPCEADQDCPAVEDGASCVEVGRASGSCQ